jgi:hypothetical protein
VPKASAPGPEPPAETDPGEPYTRAIEALKRKAATGDAKAIRALTDGTLARLEQLAGANQEPTATRAAIQSGEHRTACPGCGQPLLVTVDTGKGWAELGILALDTIHEPEPKRSRKRL